MSSYHVPILRNACVEGLRIRPGKVYLDATFGGGGHSRGILERLEEGKLFGLDRDPDTRANAEGLDTNRFQWIQADFRHARKFLRMHGVSQVAGIMADLGISSHQIDRPERGFSTRFDGPLDMRMDQKSELSAQTIVNEYDQQALLHIFKNYGELRNAWAIVQAILRMRADGPIQTTAELAAGLERLAPQAKKAKFLAQVFQAIRIEVNDELGALQELLTDSVQMLETGGRLVILTFHSLEDRLVKHFMKAGNFSGEPEKDFYGNPIVPFRLVNRKPILPSAEEVAQNGRAKSAKLRIAEKIALHNG